METLQPDPRAALGFYGALLAWEFSEAGPMPGGLPGEYFVAQIEGCEVAGIGVLPDLGGPRIRAWNTYVRVDDADVVAAHAAQLGGTVLAPPMDTPGFRSAVLLDPQGAAFSVSQVIAGS